MQKFLYDLFQFVFCFFWNNYYFASFFPINGLFFSLLKIPFSDYPRLYSIFIVLFPRIAFAIFLHVRFFFPTENFLQRESKYFSLYLLQGRHSYVIRNYQINHPPLNFSVTMTLIKLKMIYGAPRTQIYHLENNFGQYLVLTSGAIITKCH